MASKGVLYFMAVAGVSFAVVGETAPRTPIPADRLELVTGQARAVESTSGRAAIVRLLDRARTSYALRTAGQAYDLKVSFTVNSGGQTQHDGAWEMEDVFDPNLGFRWTAKDSGSYSITRISAKGMLWGEETESYVPLRLQEARAALFGPIPSAENIDRAAMRTSTALYNGKSVTCVLISGSAKGSITAPGRRWDETEECIDPQSGLLKVHSQAPGRYYEYKYANAPHFADHILPKKVIITEAGKTVTEISVDSLKEIPAADPSLFTPTGEMKSRGRAATLAGAQKVFRVSGPNPAPAGATTHVVCVYGLVTASGQLVETHSLQPSDPASQAAIADAQQINFKPAIPIGPQPQQHFVFVIEKFISAP